MPDDNALAAARDLVNHGVKHFTVQLGLAIEDAVEEAGRFFVEVFHVIVDTHLHGDPPQSIVIEGQVQAPDPFAGDGFSGCFPGRGRW